MPRLTYWPSRSSWAARAAICSRVSAISALPPLAAGSRSHGAPLDPLLDVRPDPDHPLDEDAGRVDLLGPDLPDVDHLLDLGDRDPPGRGAQRVEVARALAVDEVAGAVALPGVDQREVGDDRLLEDVRPRLARDGQLAGLLDRRRDRHRPVGGVAPGQAALRDLGADAGRREEGRDAGAAGAQPLGERALRRQLDLELAGEELPGELLVLADVGGGHAGDPVVGEEHAEPPLVDAAVVGHDPQVGGAGGVQRLDELLWDAAQAEPAHRQGGAVGDVGDRGGGRGAHLVGGAQGLADTSDTSDTSGTSDTGG